MTHICRHPRRVALVLDPVHKHSIYTRGIYSFFARSLPAYDAAIMH
jgi:hypothetical protein